MSEDRARRVVFCPTRNRYTFRLRADIQAAIIAGQADGSVRANVDPEAAAHAIVAEDISSAFIRIIDPAEDLRARIAQWRRHTLDRLATVTTDAPRAASSAGPDHDILTASSHSRLTTGTHHCFVYKHPTR